MDIVCDLNDETVTWKVLGMTPEWHFCIHTEDTRVYIYIHRVSKKLCKIVFDPLAYVWVVFHVSLEWNLCT